MAQSLAIAPCLPSFIVRSGSLLWISMMLYSPGPRAHGRSGRVHAGRALPYDTLAAGFGKDDLSLRPGLNMQLKVLDKQVSQSDSTPIAAVHQPGLDAYLRAAGDDIHAPQHDFPDVVRGSPELVPAGAALPITNPLFERRHSGSLAGEREEAGEGTAAGASGAAPADV